MKIFRLTTRAFAALLFAGVASNALAADWDAGAGEDWAKVLAAAKQEGPLVGGGCPDLSASLTRHFKEDTGLDIAFLPGSTNDIGARLHAEVAAGKVSMDIHLGGPSDIDLVKAGKLESLPELLMLPNVTDGSNWRDGGLKWVDNTKKFQVVPVEYLSTRPLINKDAVDPASIKTWDDLLKPEFKGKIAVYDASVPGAGQAAASYIASVKGIDFVKRLYTEQQVTSSRDSRQLGEWAARGLYPIVIGMDSMFIDLFHRQGITSLTPVTPTDGPGSVVGGCGVFIIPLGAPHRNAAIVFANWYLSVAGQRALIEAAHYPTLRTDLPNADIAPDLVPVAGVKYLDQYQEDWYVKARAQIRDALKSVFTQ